MANHTHDDDQGEEIEVITLESDDGEESDFALMGIIDLDGQEFAALVPAEQLEANEGEDLDLYTFRYREADDGERFFEAIEDEALAQRVFDAAVALFGDEGDDGDEGDGEE